MGLLFILIGIFFVWRRTAIAERLLALQLGQPNQESAIARTAAAIVATIGLAFALAGIAYTLQ